jgi:hypothetical protein
MSTSPVTLMVARRVAHGRYQELIAWLHEGEQLATDFPGYLGSGVLAPPPGDDEFQIIVRCADEATMHARQRPVCQEFRAPRKRYRRLVWRRWSAPAALEASRCHLAGVLPGVTALQFRAGTAAQSVGFIPAHHDQHVDPHTADGVLVYSAVDPSSGGVAAQQHACTGQRNGAGVYPLALIHKRFPDPGAVELPGSARRVGDSKTCTALLVLYKNRPLG